MAFFLIMLPHTVFDIEHPLPHIAVIAPQMLPTQCLFAFLKSYSGKLLKLQWNKKMGIAENGALLNHLFFNSGKQKTVKRKKQKLVQITPLSSTGPIIGGT